MNEAAEDVVRSGNRLRLAAASPGIELAEVYLGREAYSPHRHDNYALGLTDAGVQRFDYRGESHQSLAGDAFVLHPDELHDGRPGTDTGFGYRTLYVAPELIGQCLGAGPLPFVAQPVCRRGRLQAAIASALVDFETAPDGLRPTAIVAGLAAALAAACDEPRPAPSAIDARAMARVRERLRSAAASGIGIDELEREAGQDRWALYRQFRAAFGVSPHRYLKMRRLDIARRHIAGGLSLADAALAAGFADQSHMTRQFRETYGLTPGQWRRWTAQAASRSFNSSMRSVPQNSSPS